jgi:transposase
MQALAVELYEKLGSGNAVAKRLQISAPTAYRLLADAGVNVPGRTDPKPRARKTDDAKAAMIVADYRSGLSLVDLVAKHNVGHWTVRNCVKRANLALREVGGQKRRILPSEEAMILDWHAAGMSQTAIAAKLNCAQVTISKVLISHGIKSTNRAGRNAHGSWKGGICKTPDGYIKEYINYDDPLRSMGGRNSYAFQHRVVMARALNRALHKHETVHHINGDTSDNRIENLQLRQGKHGKGVVMKCADCGSHHIVMTKLAEAK